MSCTDDIKTQSLRMQRARIKVSRSRLTQWHRELSLSASTLASVTPSHKQRVPRFKMRPGSTIIILALASPSCSCSCSYNSCPRTPQFLFGIIGPILFVS